MKHKRRHGRRALGLLLSLSLILSLLTAPAGAVVTGVTSDSDQGNAATTLSDTGSTPDAGGSATSSGSAGSTPDVGDGATSSGGTGSTPDVGDGATSSGGTGSTPDVGDGATSSLGIGSTPDNGDGMPKAAAFQWSVESRLERDYLAAGDTGDGALSFTLTATPTEDNTLAADTVTVSANLTLPQGLSLPQGAYTYEADAGLLCDNQPVAELTGDEASSVQADYDAETGVFTVTLIWNDVDTPQSCTLSFGQDVLDWEGYTLEGSHQVKLEAGLKAQAQGAEPVEVQAPEALAALVEPAGTVTVLERQDVTCPVRYLDRDGQAAPRLEAQPQFTLFCSVDGQEAQELTAELAAQLGMAEVPQIQVTSDANSWTASLTELPARISVADGQGGAAERTLTWSIQVSSDADKYALKYLSADEAKQYSGASGAGWYYIYNEDTVDYVDGDTVSTTPMQTDLIQDVYWRDNNDEDKIRPTDASPLYQLQFAWDGSSVYQPVTEQDLAALGLESVPTAVLRDMGNNHSRLVVDNQSLPAQVTYTDGYGKQESHSLSWRLVMQDLEGYTRVEVAEDDQGAYAGF